MWGSRVVPQGPVEDLEKQWIDNVRSLRPCMRLRQKGDFEKSQNCPHLGQVRVRYKVVLRLNIFTQVLGVLVVRPAIPSPGEA
jgi:hypothetical protein